MSDKTSLSDLARQAGFVLVNGQHCRSIASPEDLEKFAALHRASIIAELCANAVEPVYELRHIGGLWVNSTTGDYELAQKTRGYETRILYRAETVAALLARVAELAKDAERYRFLRDNQGGDNPQSWCVFRPVVNEYGNDDIDPVGSMPGELDAAIDEALRSKK